ncbi:DUF4349 domain-containing protein [Lysobacter humi (ex Lee et al. 2017)]
MARPARIALPASLLLLALASAGCSRRDSAASAQHAEVAAADAATSAEMPPANLSKAGSAPAAPAPRAGVDGPGVDPDAMGSATLTQDTGPRRFIRTAQVEGQVADVLRSARRIEDLAASHGGFVTRNDVRTDVTEVRRQPRGDGTLVELATYTLHGDVQVRVPSDRAQPFLRQLAAELEFLDARRFAAVDAQFELLRQQLAQARHQQAQAALGQVGGGKPGEQADVIGARADQQLQRDEALVARRTFEDRVAFATLDIAMRQPERVRRSERPDVDAILRHEGPGFLARAGRALAAGWRGVQEAAIVALALWPLWLAAAAAVALLRTVRRMRRARSDATRT